LHWLRLLWCQLWRQVFDDNVFAAMVASLAVSAARVPMVASLAVLSAARVPMVASWLYYSQLDFSPALWFLRRHCNYSTCSESIFFVSPDLEGYHYGESGSRCH
jgi:hypothetical protein